MAVFAEAGARNVTPTNADFRTERVLDEDSDTLDLVTLGNIRTECSKLASFISATVEPTLGGRTASFPALDVMVVAKYQNQHLLVTAPAGMCINTTRFEYDFFTGTVASYEVFNQQNDQVIAFGTKPTNEDARIISEKEMGYQVMLFLQKVTEDLPLV